MSAIPPMAIWREQHTNTVETQSIQSRSDITGESLTAAISLGTFVKPSIVSPASNSKADLDIMIEKTANLLERLERLVLSSRLGCKERRVGKRHHDVGDAAG
jgi:hypothetical protein